MSTPTGPRPGPKPPTAFNRAERFLQSEGVNRLLADVEAARSTVSEGNFDQMPTGQEVRVVDASTGGAKGSKLARFSLLPWDVLREVAEHYGRGARKYEDRNWQRGYKWSLSYDALQRHLESFWNRDDVDHDPALYLDDEPHTARHIIAVVWHALALAWFSLHGKGTDDRPELP